MWCNGTVTAARKLRIAYNHSLRRLFGIPENNSASEMFVQLNNLKNLELVVRHCNNNNNNKYGLNTSIWKKNISNQKCYTSLTFKSVT